MVQEVSPYPREMAVGGTKEEATWALKLLWCQRQLRLAEDISLRSMEALDAIP